ncbi:hypothetical protein [Halomontanus rarus]|uniref:hypothetical protein n=1 Tax=Halomontanus rarus TaxID=3034020 RepID=UPI001A98FBB1
MERRKILLGSGVTLATALAGCMGGADNDGNGNDENGNGDDTKNGNGDDTKNGNDDDDGSKDHDDDAPGIDVDELDDTLSKFDVSVTVDKRDGDELYVDVVVGESYDKDSKSVPEGIGDSAAKAIEDRAEFAAKIDTVYVTARNGDDVEIASFRIEVDWLIDYRDGKLSEEELGEKIYDTMSS